MTDEHNKTLRDLLLCFLSWEPQVRVLGNVRADDAADAIRSALLSDGDSKRIDWLEQEDGMGFFHNIDHITANINEGFNGFKTLREAIDASIKEST